MTEEHPSPNVNVFTATLHNPKGVQNKTSNFMPERESA